MRIASLATAVILAFSANVYASYMDSIRARCEAYGSTPGTRDFYQCLHDVSVQEQKLKEVKAAEPLLTGCQAAVTRLPFARESDNPVLDSGLALRPASSMPISPCSIQNF